MRPGDLVLIEGKILGIIVSHPKKTKLVGYIIPVLKPDGTIQRVYPESLEIVSKGALWPKDDNEQ